MKKTAIAITVVLVLASFATVVQAATFKKDNTWYVGGKFGFSQFHNTCWYNSLLNNDDQIHKSQFGAGALCGYQTNQYVSFEMGYDRFSSMPYKGDILQAHGVQLTAKLGYPVIDNLDVYTRLGGMVWRTDFSNGVSSNGHGISIAPMVAGGLEWSMTSNIATHIEYQLVNNIDDCNAVGIQPDNGMLSLGISYRFGRQKETPVVAQVPIPKVQTKHLTLQSDVLFNFNRATIKSEGQLALNQLLTQLSNIDLQDGSLLVLGFADRIGSNAYNQDLSEKRAQSVVDYLVSKGIPACKISARSMSESHPVTGTTCNDVKARSALINCLAPDRRVEIKIEEGARDVVVNQSAT